MTGIDQTFRAEIDARIDRMPFSKWHVQLSAVLGSAHFFDALDATALAFVLPILVVQWHLTPTDAGLLISASYVGQYIGAIAGGMIAERAGRITTLRMCLTGMALLSLACAFAQTYLVLLVLRMIQGLGLGAETPVAAAYMNEACPPRFRGRATIAIQLMFGAGSSAAAVLALFLIPRFGWQSMFVLGSFPIVIALVLRRLLPESPRWLATNGRDADAEAAIGAMERGVYGAAIPAEPLPAIPPPPSPPALRRPGFKALLAPELLRPTISGWIAAFCVSVVGYALIGWMPTIYRTVYHLPVQTALRYSAVSGVTSLLGASLGILLIDRVGRKASLILGFAGSACFLAVIAIGGPTLSPVLVMLAASGALMMLGLPLSGIYAYVPELYPTEIRAFGMGVASSWLRLASIISPPLIGMLLTVGGARIIFTSLVVTAVIGALGLAWLGVETKGRRGAVHSQ